MTKDNPSPIACIRVADVPTGTSISCNVTEGTCPGCGAPIYIANSSRNIIAAGIGKPFCNQCVDNKLLIQAILFPGKVVKIHDGAAVAQKLKEQAEAN